MWSRRRKDFPAAVLIRAIQPIEGVDVMMERRSGRDTFGPGKLTQAMGITEKREYCRSDGNSLRLMDRGGSQSSKLDRDEKSTCGFK